MVGTDLSTDSTLESGDVGQWSRSDLVIVCTPGSISNTSISRPFHIAAIKRLSVITSKIWVEVLLRPGKNKIDIY